MVSLKGPAETKRTSPQRSSNAIAGDILGLYLPNPYPFISPTFGLPSNNKDVLCLPSVFLLLVPSHANNNTIAIFEPDVICHIKPYRAYVLRPIDNSIFPLIFHSKIPGKLPHFDTQRFPILDEPEIYALRDHETLIRSYNEINTSGVCHP